MEQEHPIVRQVLSAQKDPDAADALIEQYLPFIRSETVKHIPSADLSEDALSVAMFAFYEAAMAYRPERGAFLKFASFAIRNRLIDQHRKQKNRETILSLDQPVRSGEDFRTVGDTVADRHDAVEEGLSRQATREEIEQFQSDLAGYGLTLSKIADSCPKQERTLSACLKALQFARETPELLEKLIETKKLPISALAKGAGVEKKTLERHRDYLIGILLAFTNGFEIIRGHLVQMQAKEVRRA